MKNLNGTMQNLVSRKLQNVTSPEHMIAFQLQFNHRFATEEPVPFYTKTSRYLIYIILTIVKSHNEHKKRNAARFSDEVACRNSSHGTATVTENVKYICGFISFIIFLSFGNSPKHNV